VSGVGTATIRRVVFRGLSKCRRLPFLAIIVQATGSQAAGAVFMTAFLLVLLVSSNSVHQATSRLMYVASCLKSS
jgi:hypothetical protein